MKTKSKYRLLDFIILGIYIGMSIVLFFYHEPWFDEAQNWLSVKHRSIIDIYRGVALDGHPMSWLLIIMPLAKLGLPYKSVFIFHHILNWIGVSLFYFKSPFHKITKVLFIFSVYIFFDYNVICKNYVLIFLFLTGLAIIYPNKKEHKVTYLILLCLLINTHVYAAVIGISIVLADTIQQVFKANSRIFNAEQAKHCILHYTLLLLSILILIGGFLMSDPLNEFTFSPLIEIDFYKRLFFYSILPFTYALDYKVAYLLLFPLSILYLLVLRRNTYAFLILAASTIGISYLYYLGYPHSGVHVGILFLLIYYVLWLYLTKPDNLIEIRLNFNLLKLPRFLISLLKTSPKKHVFVFSLVVLPCLNYWAIKKTVREIKFPFSNSWNVANYLIDNGYDNKDFEIYTYPADNTLPILPHLKQIDSLNYYSYRKGNYIEWDTELGMHYYDYANDIDRYFENSKNIALSDSSTIFILALSRDHKEINIPNDFIVLAKFEGAVLPGENYVVFKLR